MHIFCDTCKEKCATFVGWMEHLLCAQHHQNTGKEISQWTDEMNERAIIVSNLKDISPEETAWYFASEGFVSDFHYYQKKLKLLFIIQYDSRETAEKCLEKPHSIEGSKAILKWKTEYDATTESSLGPYELDFNQRHFELNQSLAASPLSSQLKDFINLTTLSEEHCLERHNFMLELTKLLKTIYPNCVLYPFGSTITNLADKDADVDVCVDAEDNFSNDRSYSPYSQEKKDILNKVVSLLRRHSDFNAKKHAGSRCLFSSVTPIKHARVPIVKLIHFQTGIKCDLSFENLLSVQNSKMIAFYCSLDLRIYPLLHLIRYWGRYHDITGSYEIKNYALILLILTFLQKKRIVPSVHFLQTLPGSRPFFIEGWNASYHGDKDAVMAAFKSSSERIPVLTNEDGTATTRSVLQLAYEFFQMFAFLDLETQVIYPLMGSFIAKYKFKDEKNLPDELHVYKSWLNTFDNRNDLRLENPLCIMDPFSLNFNVGSCASELVVYKFQKSCKETAERLKGMLAVDNIEANICMMDMFFPVLTTEFRNGLGIRNA